MNNIHKVIARQKKFAVFPIVCADHCARLLNMTLSDITRDGKTLAHALEYGYTKYNYDMVLIFTDPYVEAQALGCPVRLEPFPTLIGPQSKERYDRTPVIIEAARILKQRLHVPLFVSIKGPFSLAAFCVGMEDFLKRTVNSEKETKNKINEVLEFQMHYLEQLLSIGAHIFIGDPVASASVISPLTFSKYALAPLKALVDCVKQKNQLCGIHICGDTQPLVVMLDTLGADILSIEDISPATRTTKMGGVRTETIRSGTMPELLEEIQHALSHPHLIVSTACDVPADTQPENIETMVRTVHDASTN